MSDVTDILRGAADKLDEAAAKARPLGHGGRHRCQHGSTWRNEGGER